MSSLRAILSKVPVNVRVDFLESMSFGNGSLVSIGLAELRGVLSKPGLQALMESCGCKQGYMCYPPTGECLEHPESACNAESCAKVKGDTIVALGVLLQGTPPEIRRHFLDSLDFEHGHLTRADTHLVEEHIEEAMRKHLPHVYHK